MRVSGRTFCLPMVQAIDEGRKTMTRRILNPQPALSHVVQLDEPGWFGDEEGDIKFRCRWGGPGDLVYVRENWRVGKKNDHLAPRDITPMACTIAFQAGGSIANQDFPGDWRPSPASYNDESWIGRHRAAMHLPRWASRFTLKITDVKVRRLQSITEADAQAEGAQFGFRCACDDGSFLEGPQGFKAIWEDINGAGSWGENPLVYVISFEVIRQNIDYYLRSIGYAMPALRNRKS